MSTSKKNKNAKSALKSQEIRNRKAFHDYFVGDSFECGMVLLGPEVKSLRCGHAQISDAFVRPNRTGELFLYNANIAEYAFCVPSDHSCTRPKKLLLHASEIKKIISAIERDRKVVIPLKIYFKHGLAKVEIAICSSKKQFDKRESLKKKEALRETHRAISSVLRNR